MTGRIDLGADFDQSGVTARPDVGLGNTQTFGTASVNELALGLQGATATADFSQASLVSLILTSATPCTLTFVAPAYANCTVYLRVQQATSGTATTIVVPGTVAPGMFVVLPQPSTVFSSYTMYTLFWDGTSYWLINASSASTGGASPLTTKGDIFTRSATVDIRLPVSATDTDLLSADSSQTTGLKWVPRGLATIPVGLDKNRPAASTVGIYLATDSGSLYTADGTTNRVFSLPEKSGYSGFSRANYIQSQSPGANVGPTMTSAYTVLWGFDLLSLPGSTTQVVGGYYIASVADGWYLALGTSGGNANRVGVFMAGLNGGSYNEFTSMSALTVGPHSIAISWDGTTLKLVVDGGSAFTLTPSGTYISPTASSNVTLGTYAGPGGGFSFAGGALSYLYGYASALSTADMQTLTTSPGNYFPGVITANPSYAWSSKLPIAILGWKVWGSAVPSDGTANLSVFGSLGFREF